MGCASRLLRSAFAKLLVGRFEVAEALADWRATEPIAGADPGSDISPTVLLFLLRRPCSRSRGGEISAISVPRLEHLERVW